MSRSVSRFALVVGLALLLAAFASHSDSRGGDNQVAEKPSADREKSAADKPEAADVVSEISTEQTPVELALAKKVDLDFVEVPLTDFAKAIGAMGGINVLLDSKALTDAGVNGGTPITGRVKQIALRSGLRLILQMHELNCFAIEDNVLLITTDAKAKEHIVVRLYDVRDLTMPSSRFIKPEVDFDAIIELITLCIAPTSWTDSGGIGSITVQNGILVVPQTQEIHNQIADLLATLRQVREQQRHGAAIGAVFVGDSADGAEEKIRRLLETRRDFDFTQVPLKDVAEVLQKDGLEVRLDEKAITDAGVNSDTPITFRAKHVRIGFALAQLLQEHELNYIIDHEVLLITADTKAKEFITLAIYPVADLIADDDQSRDQKGKGYDELVNSITTTIAPTSWASAGGAGEIVPAPFSKALVVAQSCETHKEIRELLTSLRKFTDSAKKPNPDEHSDAGTPKPTVKIYQLALNNAGSVKEYAAVIRDLLVQAHPSIDAAYVGTVPGAIVVRALPAVHEQIRELLE
ncbi:MAG TPA: hypothetical protein VG056_16580 [Pirellulales bacterium]|nr:hypothetical protein [Pirellulales bacterium]